MTKEQTDQIFYPITSNGCREMDEVRFHQAVKEAISLTMNIKQMEANENKKILMIHLMPFSSGRIEVIDYGWVNKSSKHILKTLNHASR